MEGERDGVWCRQDDRNEETVLHDRGFGGPVRRGEEGTRILRVVMLAGGETIYSASFDRRFRKG